MPYDVFIAAKAEKDFTKLPKIIQRRVIGLLTALKDNPRLAGARKLSGFDDYYRLRLGAYRVVYGVDDKNKMVNVFRIRHRKEAYRRLI